MRVFRMVFAVLHLINVLLGELSQSHRSWMLPVQGAAVIGVNACSKCLLCVYEDGIAINSKPVQLLTNKPIFFTSSIYSSNNEDTMREDLS